MQACQPNLMWPCTKERHAKPLPREEQVRCGYFCEQIRVVRLPSAPAVRTTSATDPDCVEDGEGCLHARRQRNHHVSQRGLAQLRRLCGTARCALPLPRSTAGHHAGGAVEAACRSTSPAPDARRSASPAPIATAPRAGAHILWNKHRQSDSSGQHTRLTQLFLQIELLVL
jgi:hypothetical protein